jgi:hypothetical protein
MLQFYKKVDPKMRHFFWMNKKISILVSFSYKYLPVVFIYTHVAVALGKTNEQRSNVRKYVCYEREGFLRSGLIKSM